MTHKSAPLFSFGLTQHSSPLCIAGATHKLSVSMGVRDSTHLSIVFLSLIMHMAPMSAFSLAACSFQSVGKSPHIPFHGWSSPSATNLTRFNQHCLFELAVPYDLSVDHVFGQFHTFHSRVAIPALPHIAPISPCRCVEVKNRTVEFNLIVFLITMVLANIEVTSALVWKIAFWFHWTPLNFIL